MCKGHFGGKAGEGVGVEPHCLTVIQPLTLP